MSTLSLPKALAYLIATVVVLGATTAVAVELIASNIIAAAVAGLSLAAAVSFLHRFALLQPRATNPFGNLSVSDMAFSLKQAAPLAEDRG